MQPQQPQPSASAGVQAQPTPFTPQVFRGQLPNGDPVVILQLMMLTGVTTVFFPPEAATALGQDLIANGRGAASGLVLPPGVRLGEAPPHTDNGHRHTADPERGEA